MLQLTKMEEESPLKEAMREEREKKGVGFALIGEDLLQDILSRLPALSYASAACVSRSWNRLCNQILSRPKLVSALSLNPLLEVAVQEALDKVLSQPIRPHFAIACVGRQFGLKRTHHLIMQKLGPGIPIITSEARGIIGSHAVTDEFREVKWEDDNEEFYNSSTNVDRGIVLIVGFVPGLKVHTIPLMQSSEGPPQMSLIDKFVIHIKDYTASVSSCNSPLGIIMFADQYSDMKPVLDKMNYGLSGETVIIGDECGCFLYNSGGDSTTFCGNQQFSQCQNTKDQTYQTVKLDAVALVFASDRSKHHGIGEVQFGLALSTGVSPVGPTYKGVSVRVATSKESESSTWLTARREGSREKLDGQRILQDIDNELENDIYCDLYVGVTKRRKYSIGSEKGKFVSSLAFHEVLGGDEEYLYIKGDGMKTGDSFRFYHPNPETALVSRNNVFEDLRTLKQFGYSKCFHLANGTENGDKREVCGGIVFSCCGRGESFFERQNVDSSAFLENFPGVPLGGMFCGGEIGRSSWVPIRRDDGGQSTISCCLHVYSAVYLVMLYTPKPLANF